MARKLRALGGCGQHARASTDPLRLYGDVQEVGGTAGKKDSGFDDALDGRIDDGGRPAAHVESLHRFSDVVVNGIVRPPEDLANFGGGFSPGDPGQALDLTRRKQTFRSF